MRKSDNVDNLESWAEEMSLYHLPRWENLPDFEIYMDQAVELLGQYLTPLFSAEANKHIVTHTMINNYVKQQLIPKPEKRKYNKEHLASIIVITILKRILTIPEISAGITDQVSKYGEKDAYNNFCDTAEESLHILMHRILGEYTGELVPKDVAPTYLLLQIATAAFAGQIVTEKVMYYKQMNKVEEM